MPEIVPSAEQMTRLVGKPLYEIWTQLCALIDEKYDMDRLWGSGGKAWTYEYKYRRGGKTLCALYARENCIGFMVILGKDERLKFEDDKEHYAPEVQNIYDGTPTYHDGKWLIPTRLFKQAVSLSRQARAIEATLDGINPLNAGKKKEEALSMLKKWFPQMENFSGQLKKYKVTINDLLAENEKLEARARASESGKIKDRMERAKLESELHDMQRLVDRIPPDILAELKRQQRQHGKER